MGALGGVAGGARAGWGAGPSPSPSLDSGVAKPPSSDFAELTTGQLHGEFTAHDWATSNGTSSTSATETEATLNRDGFVDGFGKTWASSAAGPAVVGAVIAVTGGVGGPRGAHPPRRPRQGGPPPQTPPHPPRAP